MPDPSGARDDGEEIRVFLTIPYKKTYRRYEDTIRAVLRSRGLYPVIARESSTTRTILEEVCVLIDSCRYAIVDISGWNFNVALETGYIIARGLPYAILKNGRTKPPADLRGFKYQEYRNVETMRKKLVRWVDQNVPEAKELPEARVAKQLIERIMRDADMSRKEAEDFLLAVLQPRG